MISARRPFWLCQSETGIVITQSLGALKKRSQAIASQAAEMHRKGDPRAPIWQRRAGIYAVEEADRAHFGELGYCEQARQLAPPAPARAATCARSSDAPALSEPTMSDGATRPVGTATTRLPRAKMIGAAAVVSGDNYDAPPHCLA